MKRRLQKIGKPTLIIIVLAVLNISAFSILSASSQIDEDHRVPISTTSDTDSYFKSGVDVLNWTYSLLKHFKRK